MLQQIRYNSVRRGSAMVPLDSALVLIGVNSNHMLLTQAV